MKARTIEDSLREEYFTLLPNIRRVKEQLETIVKYELLPILNNLETHERFDVFSRVKDCESAVNSLRRRQEGATFDRRKPEKYSLTQLRDLAGVRVLVFPRGLISRVNKIVLNSFDSWVSDPVPSFNDDDDPLALKYYGHTPYSNNIIGEIQIVPMLTGLFWEVEHAAIYKPKPEFKGISRSLEMRQQTQKVLNELKNFEETFEKLISKGRNNGSQDT